MINSVPILTRKVIHLFTAIVIGGLTLGTTVAGATKLASSFQPPLPPVPQLAQATQETPEIESDSIPQNYSPPPNRPINSPPTLMPTSVPTHPVAIIPTPTPKPVTNNNNTPTNQCLVTLFGAQYDVTPLRGGHPGGDIFVCGTDMTAVYQSQHGSDVSQMAPYLVASTGSGTPTNPPPVYSGGYTDDDHDEYEAEAEDDDRHSDLDSSTHEYEDDE